MRIDTEEQLEDSLSQPNDRDIAMMRRLQGDVLVLGAGGKMGPSLARRVMRAAQAAGMRRRVIAVSRFSSEKARNDLEYWGVETIACDLLDPVSIAKLETCPNVLFLAGRKFGSSERVDLTWAVNAMVPVYVARHFPESRIVVFSTGNVYPFVEVASGGSVETDAPCPVGEYAQSCLARERIFEYYSNENGTPCLILRLNYATDLRYGVLVDIARKVLDGHPLDLGVGAVNTLWQGDANSYALRCLELCESPARILNVTGPETVSVRQAADFFAQRFGRPAILEREESSRALLSNASACHEQLGPPEVPVSALLESVADWVQKGGAVLDKPTRFEVTDGRF